MQDAASGPAILRISVGVLITGLTDAEMGLKAAGKTGRIIAFRNSSEFKFLFLEIDAWLSNLCKMA